MAVLAKGARITGPNRTKLAGDLKKRYDKGASIRELAEFSGRSYGFIHRVLAESGVTLRGRGGATRSKAVRSRVKKSAVNAGTSTRASRSVDTRTTSARTAAAKPAKGK
jgi:predicted transcriptional regulator